MFNKFKTSRVLCLCSTLLLVFSLEVRAQSIPADPSNITISAVGDVMMGTNFPTDRLRADGGRGLFDQSEAYFRVSDIRFVNLEGPLFDGAQDGDGKSAGQNRYIFRTPTSYIQWLQRAGINVASLANNHAADFGASGVRSTKMTLQNAGIQYSSKLGGEVAHFEIRGTSVALIAVDYYSGQRNMNSPATMNEIRQLKSRYDIVIVSAHAGAEGSGQAEHVTHGPELFLGENRGDSVKFAHGAVDAGADLILMHGPHVARAMEIYSDRLIAYSLGNFITESGISVQGTAGLAPLLRVQMNRKGQFLKGDITSFRQVRPTGTVYDSSRASMLKIKALSELDFPQTMPQFDVNTGMISRKP